MIEYKDDITSCILGAKGSGKTVLLAHMQQKYNAGSSVLFDTIGVLNPRSQHRSAVVPNSIYFMTPESFIAHFDRLPKKYKAVINFENYIGEDLIEAVDKVCTLLYTSKNRVMLLSDEVADIIPQMAKGSKKFELLVKNGRNYGIKPVIIATQRPQSVNKAVFDLCDNFYISSQKAPRTIDYIMDIIDMRGNKEIRKKVMGLRHREFIKFDGASLKQFMNPKYKYAHKQ
jgi:DNA helicase HerA-like ATPase